MRLPLVGSFTSRDGTNAALFSSSQKDQMFEDCAFHVTDNAVTGKKTVKVGARHKFVESSNPVSASGSGTACKMWRSSGGTGVYAFGSTNSTLYDNGTSLGSITGQCVHMSETLVGADPTMVFLSSSGGAWYYPSGGALTQITDADFPPNQTPSLVTVGNFAYIDGYAFIMTSNGQIWHSDVNSLVNWTSTASIMAQEFPDLGMSVARYRNFIIAFSEYSLEFFTNNGNAAGAVLSRVQSMARQVGLVNPFCLREVGDSYAFIGQTPYTIGVFLLENGEPKKISTDAIDKWFQASIIAASPATLFRMHILTSHNKTYIAVAASANTANMQVYDLATGLWQPWTLEYAIRQSDARGGSSIAVGDSTTKGLNNFDGELASAKIQTDALDFGSRKRKALKTIRVVGDKATATSTITIAWSDDDGQTWSSGRTVDMAANDPKLERCGIFRRRAFRITGLSTADTNRDQLIEAIDLDIEEMVL